jgi:hypothetical protein
MSVLFVSHLKPAALKALNIVRGEHLKAYCDSEELRHRGWSRKWRKHLGQADGWRKADPFADGMLSAVWHRSTVDAVEATDEWKADRSAGDRLAFGKFGRDLPALRSARLQQYSSIRS